MMHRRSSRGAPDVPRASDALPLRGLPRAQIAVVVEVTRAGRVDRHELTVEAGVPIRVVLRKIGQAPEGSAVLVDDTPVPLDRTIDGPTRLTVVPTFSGG